MRGKSSKYTITIAYQEEGYVIFPDRTTSWDLQAGDTIKFANKTDNHVIVIQNPQGWLDPDPRSISAGYEETGVVKHIEAYKAPLEFLFTISAEGGDFMVSGGPKMVPTNPDS